MSYEGASIPTATVRDYLRANGAAKVAGVASRYTGDDAIDMPAWATVSIGDPRRSVADWPAVFITAGQSVNGLGGRADSRGYRFEFGLLAKSKSEEKAKLLVMRYVEALMEALLAMNEAKVGVRWILAPLPDELYFPTYTNQKTMEHMTDARLIATAITPTGDGWPC